MMKLLSDISNNPVVKARFSSQMLPRQLSRHHVGIGAVDAKLMPNPDITDLEMSVSTENVQQTRPIQTRKRPFWLDRSAKRSNFRYPGTHLAGLNKRLVFSGGWWPLLRRAGVKPAGLSRRCHDNSPRNVSALSAQILKWCDSVTRISQANGHQNTFNCADTVCTISNTSRLTDGNDTTEED